MDPDETYKRLCDNVNAVLCGVEGDIVELAEAFEALDLWLKDGGFFPAAWEPARLAALDSFSRDLIAVQREVLGLAPKPRKDLI